MSKYLQPNESGLFDKAMVLTGFFLSSLEALSAKSKTLHTLQSSPESGGRAGYDGDKRRKGSTGHIAVATLGHLLARKVTPANEPDRAQVGALSAARQEATGQSVEVAFVDQGYPGEKPAEAAPARGVRREVIKLAEAKRGFVFLPRRWVVERSCGWAARFHRLARDYQRLAPTLAALYWLAFSTLLLRSIFQSP